MLINAINPYWWAATPLNVSSEIDRIDVGGIFKLTTNAVALTKTTVDYGINPCVYNRLPSESIVLLTIHADIPAGGETLPVTIAIPSNSSTTVNSSTTKKVNIVDSQGTNVTGANVKGNTQRLMYINKCTGVMRFMEFTNATT